jgi:hypothetical protein
MRTRADLLDELDFWWDKPSRFLKGLTCQVPCGCDKPARMWHEGLAVCTGHDRQRSKGRKYTPLRRRRPTGLTCQAPCGCDKPACRWNGDGDLAICIGHYQQQRRGKKYASLQKPAKGLVCQAPCGCDRPADQWQNDLPVCAVHAAQRRRGGEYTPLGKKRPFQKRRLLKGTVCQAPCGCNSPARRWSDDLGVCQAHWAQRHEGKEYTPLHQPRKSLKDLTCQAPCGCDRPAYQYCEDLPVCATHGRQHRKGKEYMPIRCWQPKGQAGLS